jgi:uncharacterized MAPEG superfamily protein
MTSIRVFVALVSMPAVAGSVSGQTTEHVAAAKTAFRAAYAVVYHERLPDGRGGSVRLAQGTNPLLGIRTTN